MATRRSIWVRASLALAAAAAISTPAPGRAGAAEAPPENPAAPAWEWGPSIMLYVLQDEPNFLLPTLTADRGSLHVEGRYNYEDRETGSAWVGWNFSVGKELELGLTPMIGGVFGRTNGIAPALTLTLDWGPLSFWSQSEYVFDLGNSADSFFYAWSELDISYGDWLRAGLAVQRTRVFETATEAQAGPFVAVSFRKVTASAYLFAPGYADQFVALALAGSF